jgi:hypothetical protein
MEPGGKLLAIGGRGQGATHNFALPAMAEIPETDPVLGMALTDDQYDVQKPFDARPRLWVSQQAGGKQPVKDQRQIRVDLPGWHDAPARIAHQVLK